MMSKEQQQLMKACLDDSMRTDSGTEASLPKWILDRYDKYRTFAVFSWTSHKFGQELDMCNNKQSTVETAVLAFLFLFRKRKNWI